MAGSFADYDANGIECLPDCRSIGCDRCAQEGDDFCLRCRDEIDALRSTPWRRSQQRRGWSLARAFMRWSWSIDGTARAASYEPMARQDSTPLPHR
jgi:hypothetical protein